MKNKNELLDKQNKNVTFEEMEKVEEFGAAQDEQVLELELLQPSLH